MNRIRVVRHSLRLFSSKDKAPVPAVISEVKNPWVEQKDPNGSALTYYWNKETNETTPLGSEKPRNWIKVKDPQGSGLVYWWDPDSNETTALGAPKPSGLTTNYANQNGRVQFIKNVSPNQTLGQSMVQYAFWGAGLTFAFVAVRAILGF